MRDTVYVVIFDGFADWQVALALCEIRRPGDWELRMVGATHQAVQAMSGMRVLPHATLEQIDDARAAVLLVPGGHRWEDGAAPHVVAAIRRLHAGGALIAAIGSGSLPLVQAGLHGDPHGYAPSCDSAPQIAGEVSVIREPGVICASAFAGVDFACEVIRALDLYDADDTACWECWFKPLPHACGSDSITARALDGCRMASSTRDESSEGRLSKQGS